MKRKIIPMLVFLSLSLRVTSLDAVAVKQLPITVEQPDGTAIHCFITGDETSRWLHNANNFLILKHPRSGIYVWAIQENSRIVPSNYTVHENNPGTLGIQPGLRPETAISDAHQRSFRAAQQALSRTPYCPSKGTIQNPVIFIRFSDQSDFEGTIARYDSIYNDSTEGAFSLINYFKEVSYQQLNVISSFFPTPDNQMIVSYQDTLPRSFYTKSSPENPDGYSQGLAYTRERVLLTAAANSIANQVPSDLNIDSNDDGFVDHVCFIIRGKQTEWASLLWPHFSSLAVNDSANAYINGKRVGMYSLLIEQFADFGLFTGTLAHEMFHAMSAPDLYHYGKDDLIPVGEWDIMSYSYPEAPHPGAYMKYQYGHWIDDIPEISEPGTYSLKPLTEASNNCYKIASPYSETEFFVLEYRKRKPPFETHGMMGSGLVVYRVDTTNGLKGNSSGPPDGLYIYRPGGTPTYNGNQWEAHFSSDVARTKINDATDPSSFLQDGSAGGLNLFNIGSADDSITFEVSLEPASFVTLTAPNAYANLQVGDKVTLQWRCAGITSFEITYSIDGGRNWLPVTTGISQNEYQWLIPYTITNNCVIRISDAAHPDVFSDVPCYISDAENFYPLVMNYDLTATDCNFNSGVVAYNDKIWVSLWNMNKISCFDVNGTFIESFPIDGLQLGIASMTFDEQQFIYAAGYGSKYFYKINPETRTVVDSILNLDNQYAGFCSFDPDANNGAGGLWIGFPGSISLYLIDLQGQPLDTLAIYQHHLLRLNGIAHDAYSDGGPYLWLFDNGAGQGLPQFLYRLHIESNTLSQEFHDVNLDLGTDPLNKAGDLFFTRSLWHGKILVGGVMSYRDDNRLFAYDISTPLSNIQEAEGTCIDQFLLTQNYPNPFNAKTIIHYQLPKASRVSIKLFNIFGQEICTVVDDKKEAGIYKVSWDSKNNSGDAVASGIYFYQISADNFIKSSKMILIR